jgi:hypothetical protein
MLLPKGYLPRCARHSHHGIQTLHLLQITLLVAGLLVLNRLRNRPAP